MRILAFVLGLTLAMGGTSLADGTLTNPSAAAFQNSSGLTVPVACDNVAFANGTNPIITGVSNKKIYICSVQISGTGASAFTISLVTGTGATCGTGQVQLDSVLGAAGGVINYSQGVGIGIIYAPVPASTNVCAASTGTPTSTPVTITYAQF